MSLESYNVLLPEAGVRISYVSSTPSFSSSSLSSHTIKKGTILLIHGFPQTPYQFRHIIPLLSSAGYTVIAPAYRGAGLSSRPPPSTTGTSTFTKSTLAADLFELVHSHLGIKERIHVVGHDVGGMVAHAYATRYADHVASVTWGECPLPGTSSFREDFGTVRQFHFAFHAVGDLPEALVSGRERIYVRHFLDKLCFNTAAFKDEDVDVYVDAYSQPGALRCAFATYAAFETDAVENERWRDEHGKSKVPALMASGEKSHHCEVAETMGKEMYENVQVAEIKNSGHWIAEEGPDEFVEKLLRFINQNN